MLSIIVPVYNEEPILEGSVRRLRDYLTNRGDGRHEIILVDNGSSDASAAVAQKLSAEFPEVRAIQLPERGPGAAFKLAAQQAQGDILLTLDADLSSDLSFIEHALALLPSVAMVVGSKTFGRQRRGPLRILASQTYITLAQLLLDLSVSDYSMGCKAMWRADVVNALPHLNGWTGYVLELIVFLQKRGKRIVQIGVNCEDRRTSHFRLLHEGVFRFRHLFRIWQEVRRAESWLNVA